MRDFDWTKMILPIIIGALILIFSNVFGIWFPIIISIIAVIYLISPIDFLPFIPVDDIFILLGAVGSWVLYFITPAINIILWVIFGFTVIIAIIYAITKLSGKEPEKYLRRRNL